MYGEASVASDYQGETIQVFVFGRGRYLGYQCFAQDRVTIGGGDDMDLSLPSCPAEEGYWDVYVSGGALYVWRRPPQGARAEGAGEDPRRVEPLDTFSLGDYRFQVKLLEARGFSDFFENEAGSRERKEEAAAGENGLSTTEKGGRDETVGGETVGGGAGVSPGSEQQGHVTAGTAEPFAGPTVPPRDEGGDGEGLECVEGGETAEVGVAPPEEVPAADASEEALFAGGGRPASGGEEEDRYLREERASSGETAADAAGRAEASEGEEAAHPGATDAISGAKAEEGGEEQAGEEVHDGPGYVQGFSLEYVKSIWGMGEGDQAARSPSREEDREEIGDAACPAEEEEAEGVSGEAHATPVLPSSTVERGEPEDPALPTMDERVEAGLDTTERQDLAAPVSGAEDGHETRVGVEEAAEGIPSAEAHKATGPDEGGDDAIPSTGEDAGQAPRVEQGEEALRVGPLAGEVAGEQAPVGVASVSAEFATDLSAGMGTGAGVDAAAALEEEVPEEEDGEAEEVDEEEEDEEGPIEYFSLLKHIFPDRKEPPAVPAGVPRAVEVVHFRGGDIREVEYLEDKGTYQVRRGWSRRLWKRKGGVKPNFDLVRVRKGGEAEIRVGPGIRGRVYRPQGSRDVRDLAGGAKGRRKQDFRVSLPPDAWAVLRADAGRYLVRYVPQRPPSAAPPIRPKLSTGQFKLVSLSLFSHILLILLVGLVVPDRTLEGYSREDRFARVDPTALMKLKPPAPPPRKAKKPRVKRKPVRPKPKAVASAKRSVSRTLPRRKAEGKVRGARGHGGGGGKKQVDVAQTGLLGALGGGNAGIPGGKGKSAVLLAAVTNLDAVAVPSDTTAFNLAGIAGKLGTSEIQVPTTDVIETVGAAELIKNGDGTLGALASKGTGQVKGVVREPPKAKISIRGGMSREAVLKVVNAHLDEIRDCYERELLHNPGISGKILLEWLIQKDGTVKYAKVKFTNIGHSSDLHVCLQTQVVAWKFPRPRGGQEVLVTFPFLFENMGF